MHVLRSIGLVRAIGKPAMSSSSQGVGALLSNASRLEGKAEWRYAQAGSNRVDRTNNLKACQKRPKFGSARRPWQQKVKTP
jgi:hypothetical protein